jgi:hypothetical protein
MPPSEVVNSYRTSWVQPSSLHHPLVTALGITERKRMATFSQLDQRGKAWATKAQQDWPVNIAINSLLLDMQGIKVWWTKTND